MNLLAMILTIGMCGSVIDETYSALAPVSELSLPTTPTEMVSTLLTGDKKGKGIFPKNNKKYIVQLKSKPAITTHSPKPRMPKMLTRWNTEDSDRKLKTTDIQSRIPLMSLKHFVVEQTTARAVRSLEPRKKRLMKKSAEIIYKNEIDKNKEDEEELNYKEVINQTEDYLNEQKFSTQKVIKLQEYLIANKTSMSEELEIFIPQSDKSKDNLNEQNILKLQEGMTANKSNVPEQVEILLSQPVQNKNDLNKQNSSTHTTIILQEGMKANKTSVPEQVEILLPQSFQTKNDLTEQNSSIRTTIKLHEDLIANKINIPEEVKILLPQLVQSETSVPEQVEILLPQSLQNKNDLTKENSSTQTTIKLQEGITANKTSLHEQVEILLPQSVQSKNYLNEQNSSIRTTIKLHEDLIANKINIPEEVEILLPQLVQSKTSVPEQVEILLPQSLQSKNDLKKENSSTRTTIKLQDGMMANKTSVPEQVEILLPQSVQSKDDLNKQNISTKKTVKLQESLIANETNSPEELEIPLPQSISPDMDKIQLNKLGGQTEADNLKYSIGDAKVLSNIDNEEKEDRKEFLFIDGNVDNGMSDGPIRIDLLDGILGQLTNLGVEAESITEIGLYDDEEESMRRFVVED